MGFFKKFKKVALPVVAPVALLANKPFESTIKGFSSKSLGLVGLGGLVSKPLNESLPQMDDTPVGPTEREKRLRALQRQNEASTFAFLGTSNTTGKSTTLGG